MARGATDPRQGLVWVWSVVVTVVLATMLANNVRTRLTPDAAVARLRTVLGHAFDDQALPGDVANAVFVGVAGQLLPPAAAERVAGVLPFPDEPFPEGVLPPTVMGVPRSDRTSRGIGGPSSPIAPNPSPAAAPLPPLPPAGVTPTAAGPPQPIGVVDGNGTLIKVELVSGVDAATQAVWACRSMNLNHSACYGVMKRIEYALASVGASTRHLPDSERVAGLRRTHDLAFDMANDITFASSDAPAEVAVVLHAGEAIASLAKSGAVTACIFIDNLQQADWCGAIDGPAMDVSVPRRLLTPGRHVIWVKRTDNGEGGLFTSHNGVSHAVFWTIQPGVALARLDAVLTVSFRGTDVGEPARMCALLDAPSQQRAGSRCVDVGMPPVGEVAQVDVELPFALELQVACRVAAVMVGRASKQVLARTPAIVVTQQEEQPDGPPSRPPRFDWLFALGEQEWSEASKNGGDGVLTAIFKHIGVSRGRSFWDGPGTFVEIGARDGVQSATTMLRTQHNWTGVMVDADYSNPDVRLVQAWVTADNVHGVLASQGVPEGDGLDLLVLDLGSGFHIWRAVLARQVYKPRVVALLVNAHVGSQPIAATYDPAARVQGLSSYFGATVEAAQVLADVHGYQLVYCESHGWHCYFVLRGALAGSGAGTEVPVSDPRLAPTTLRRRANYFGAGELLPRNSSGAWLTVQA